MEKRESGWYWVRINPSYTGRTLMWEPLFYQGNERWAQRDTSGLLDKHLEAVGDRILAPSDDKYTGERELLEQVAEYMDDKHPGGILLEPGHLHEVIDEYLAGE